MSTLQKGQQAPDFTLSDQSGKAVSLSDYAGRTVLVYFYPKADTPGCTTQSCAVRDALGQLAERGVAAIGISPDPPDKQAKFDAKFNLGFPLLADEHNAVAEAFGVWGEKTMYGQVYMGIIRSAFLIDEQGLVVEAWYKVSPGATVPNVLALL